MPRQRLAAGADRASAGDAGALRVGLSHPAQARPQAAGRPRRRHRGLHRPARLDRGLYSRRRLDRLRSDLRPVVRRGPSAGGGNAASPLRGADHRRRRCGGSRFLVRDAGQPHCREAAGHVSVFRHRLVRARCARRQGRCRPRSPGRPPHHGRRADLRLHRRLPVGGVEHRRARPHQAYSRRHIDPTAARPLRARRLPALQPGQMVSGRTAAALGLRPVLAQGRLSDLARRRPDRARRRGPCARERPRQTVLRGRGGTARHRSRLSHSRLRGPDQADGEGGRVARQHRPQQPQDRRSHRARADDARVRAEGVGADRLRAADPAGECAGAGGLAERNLAAAAGPAVPHPREILRSVSACR